MLFEFECLELAFIETNPNSYKFTYCWTILLYYSITCCENNPLKLKSVLRNITDRHQFYNKDVQRDVASGPVRAQKMRFDANKLKMSSLYTNKKTKNI